MEAPRTYRTRLIGYVAVLLAFLVGVVVFTYHSNRDLVLHEARKNVVRLAQQIQAQIAIEASDLSERARMVRDNASFQEYLFITHSLNTAPVALREQFQRQFGWLQIDRVVVESAAGRPIMGAQERDLVTALGARRAARARREELFFIDTPGGLEGVAYTPVSYRSQNVGLVAVTKRLDGNWMSAVRATTGGELVLVRDSTVTASTLGPAVTGQPFGHGAERVVLGETAFLVQPVHLQPGAYEGQLYFAVSDRDIASQLAERRNLMVLVAIGGAGGILIIGFMMLRNFSAPITRLSSMIEEVGEGRFPEFKRTAARDEIGYLWNQFAAMVQSLREKQQELVRVHEQLERQATTDVLTGHYNRRYLYDIFPKLLGEVQRQRGLLTVALADLDSFKPINDRFGHLFGDRVLRMFAEVLRESCRVNDFVFRLGGEEFLIVTQGGVEGAEVLAEKVRATLERRSVREGEAEARVTVSFGVAQVFESEGENALRAVLARADQALYTAKQEGRNRVAVWRAARPVVLSGGAGSG